MRKFLNQTKKEYKVATDTQIIQNTDEYKMNTEIQSCHRCTDNTRIQMNTKWIQKYKVATYNTLQTTSYFCRLPLSKWQLSSRLLAYELFNANGCLSVFWYKLFEFIYLRKRLEAVGIVVTWQEPSDNTKSLFTIRYLT